MLDSREVILPSVASIVDESSPPFKKHAQWKNVEVAIATVLLNFAVVLHSQPATATIEAKSQLLSTIGCVAPKLQEEEALFRVLTALGTILCDEDSIALAHSLDTKATIDHLGSISGKVGECTKEVLSLF